MSQVQIEKKKTGGDVAVKSEAPTPTLDVSNYINEFGGAGLENVTSENMAMPFIKLISDGSPERNRTSDKFIEGANTGMIVNTVTKKLYDGDKGLLVVPCFYKFEYVEWEQRGSDKKYPVSYYPADSDILSKTTRDKMNRDLLPSGNYIEGTNYHFVLVLNEDSSPDTTGLITMSRTQSKKSKKWNSMMKAMPKVKNSSGSYVSVPSFIHVYRLSTAMESNKLGTWASWVINHVGRVESELTLQTASEFYKTCAKGVVVKHEDDTEETEKAPF